MARYRTVLALLWGLLFSTSALAGARPAVLSVAAHLRLGDGGVHSRVVLETYALEADAAPFSTVSGAGAVVGISDPAGAFRQAARQPDRPGAPALRQVSPGRARVEMTFFLPLEPGQEEVVVRLPRCPDGRWTLEAPTSLRVHQVPGIEVVDATRSRGHLPADGVLRLSWGGSPGQAVHPWLEEAGLDLAIDARVVSGSARVRGFAPRTSMMVQLPAGVRYVAPEAGGAQVPGGTEVVPRPGGVLVRGLAGGWFDLSIPVEVGVEDGVAELRLPTIQDLGAPARGVVRVETRLPRPLEVEVPEGWTSERLGRGVQRWTVRSPAEAEALRVTIGGEVVAAPTKATVDRVQVRSRPARLPNPNLEGSMLVSEVQYRVGVPGELVLRIPPGLQIGDRIRVDQTEVPVHSEAPATQGRVIRLPLQRPSTVSVDVVQVTTGASGLGPGAWRLEVPSTESTTPVLVSWEGRLPSGVRLLGLDRTAQHGPERLLEARLGAEIFPVRWMRSTFLGIDAILTEAGPPLLLALAGLLAAYAYVFLVPPNRGTAYAVSGALAFVAVVWTLSTAAAPLGRAAGAGEGGPLSTLRQGFDALRATSELYSPASRGSGGSSAGRDPASPGIGRGDPRSSAARPAHDHEHGHPPSMTAGRGAASGHRLRREHAVDPSGTLWGPPRRGTDTQLAALEQPEAPPPDEFALVGTLPASELYLDLRVLPRAPVEGLVLLIGLLALAGAVLARTQHGPTGPALLAASFVGALAFEGRFPADGANAALLWLLAAGTATGHRAWVLGTEAWESIRRELEARRVRELRGGFQAPGQPSEGMSRGPLKPNEVTYEEVFREEEEEGITFLVAGDDGPDADPDEGDDAEEASPAAEGGDEGATAKEGA